MYYPERDCCFPYRQCMSINCFTCVITTALSIGKIGSSCGQAFLGADEALVDLHLVPPPPPHGSCRDIEDIQSVHRASYLVALPAAFTEFVMNYYGRMPQIKKQVRELGQCQYESEDMKKIARYFRHFTTTCCEQSDASNTSNAWIQTFLAFIAAMGIWSMLHIFLAAYLGGNTLFERLGIGMFWNGLIVNTLALGVAFDYKEHYDDIAPYENAFSGYIGVSNVFAYAAFSYRRLLDHGLGTALYLRSKIRAFREYKKDKSRTKLAIDAVTITGDNIWSFYAISAKFSWWMLLRTRDIGMCRWSNAYDELKVAWADEEVRVRAAKFMATMYMINTGARGWYFLKEALCKFPWTAGLSEEARIRYANIALFVILVTTGLSKVADMYDLVTGKSKRPWLPKWPTTRPRKAVFGALVFIGIANVALDGLSSFKGFNSMYHHFFGPKPMFDFNAWQLGIYLPINIIASIQPGAVVQWVFSILVALEYKRSDMEGDEPNIEEETRILLERIHKYLTPVERAQFQPLLPRGSERDRENSAASDRKATSLSPMKKGSNNSRFFQQGDDNPATPLLRFDIEEGQSYGSSSSEDSHDGYGDEHPDVHSTDQVITL